MKKLKKLSAALAALLLAFAFVSCANNANDEQPASKPAPTEPGLGALTSLKAVEGFDHVYTVEYDGDYLLDSLIAANIKSDVELVQYLTENIPSWKLAKESGLPLTINVSGAGCSSVTANNAGPAGGKIFGRNFDYTDGSAMILHTMPYEGYESVSTSYPMFVTQKLFWEPTNKVESDAVVLGLIYAPLDGMNEKGLYISILQLDDETTNQTYPNKNDVTTTVAVRYLLDKAASVDEALQMLGNFNMHNVFGTAYHYAIADNSGKSVVVEYINNEMKVTDAKVVTNHYLTPNSGKTLPEETNSSIVRYNTALTAGQNCNWNMTPAKMRDTLQAVSVKNIHSDGSIHRTIWSAVYEPNANKVTYYFRNDYTKYAEVTF